MNETYADLLRARLHRRSFLAGVAAAAVPLTLGSSAPAAGFRPVPASTDDRLRVPDGYAADVLLAWGRPLFPDVPAHDVAHQTAALQRRQFGFNCDFTAFLPFERGASDRGLLCVNHEYADRRCMFPGCDPGAPTAEQVEVEKAAHGMSIVAVRRDEEGRWSLDVAHPANRRIHAETPIGLDGPAAGHALLRTTADPVGRTVRGMLSNCGGGKTPWGTVLTCEEQTEDYFGNAGAVEDETRRAELLAFEVGEHESLYRWERHDRRFDVVAEPNESNRFGWVVEVDPFEPGSTPVKHTALGRFKHEAAACALADDGRVVVYTGDDERFQFLYKYVSAGRWDPARPESRHGLLEDGTLHVARLEEDGTGEWLPLVPAGPLAGWTLAEILVRTRAAAALLGATPMDRPEDVEVHPIDRRVYVALTNNTLRTTPGPGNPRPENPHGHVLELDEAGGDLGARRFTWWPFLLCGDPRTERTFYAGQTLREGDHLSCPDNLAVDATGNLWVATDGQPGTLGTNDALYRVPTTGADRGYPARFLTAPVGAEVTGPTLTPDGRSLFVSIQHPGEGGTLAEPRSRWPFGDVPRAAVVAVRNLDGGPIGS